jgi:predicted glycoside hydrolase/deacetylase ChbG (UPF0249 family)
MSSTRRTANTKHGQRKKFLIIHADDLGMAHSINGATFEAFQAGAISSASVMVPCPWFPEVAAYTMKRRDLDIGVHLTITSEWPNYKWGGVSIIRDASALVDPLGYFWPRPDLARADILELEAEMRAQITRAIRARIRPTHVDTHMFALLSQPALTEAYIRIAREFHLPFLMPHIGPNLSLLRHCLLDRDFTTNIVMARPEWSPQHWKDHYIDLIRALKPGLNQLIAHLGYDDQELRGITAGYNTWDAAWRQRDFDVIMSKEFRSVCREDEICIIDWRDVLRLGSAGDLSG